MFDFIITAVLVLFPADNHGSPDPLRDSPERFPLVQTTSAYALLSHSHELRSGGKGSGRLLFQSLFQMCTSRKGESGRIDFPLEKWASKAQKA